MEVSKAASILGSLGRRVNSKLQAEASRINGSSKPRPKTSKFPCPICKYACRVMVEYYYCSRCDAWFERKEYES